MKRFSMIGTAGVMALTAGYAIATGPSGPSTSTCSVSASAPKDIIDTAVSAGSFNTLAAALTAADLIDALKSDGPFTVFAPTDEAFAKLPKGTVEMLLKPENKGLLTQVLTYHVVSGDAQAGDVIRRNSWTTLNGQTIEVEVNDGGVRIDGANVVKANIDCSNGVIHVIDRVIMPNTDNIVATASEAGSFNTLLAAAKAAGLAGVLAGDGPFTVFAPTDEAFSKLPRGTVESLLKPENKQKLAEILKYHVVSGRVTASDAVGAQVADTLQGQSVRVRIMNGQLMVNGASVIASDIETSNGVIHVIDEVILPGK